MRRHLALAAVAVSALAASSVQASLIYAIDQHGVLFNFDSANPTVVLDARPIQSNQGGGFVDAVAIDFRPADAKLYVLAQDRRVYSIDVINAAPGGTVWGGVQLGNFVDGVNGTSFGFDFNPVADRLRITSDTDINLSHDVNAGGSTTVQTVLTAPYGNPSIVGSAYSNNSIGATSTTLFNIDSGVDSLTTQAPPAGGVQAVVGSLGIDVNSEELGFDIEQGTGIAYLAANVGTNFRSNLYTVNLGTGAATLVGQIANGTLVRDISVVMPPIPEPSTLGCLIALGGLTTRRSRRG